MPDDTRKPFHFDEDSYRDYARKMDQFVYGPTTTYFEQLAAAGIPMPEPDAIDDVTIRTRLWQVIAGLSTLRVYLDQTDHLSDRELYSTLWHNTLREETPAIDDIGFSTPIALLMDGDDTHLQLYLKHYADDDDRKRWHQHEPDLPIPDHQDPPYNRDALLPCANYEWPDAASWLKANWSSSAFAANRFDTTQDAIDFVEQLHAAGATGVGIDNVMLLPNHDWTPYADTLIVQLPEEPDRRRALFELIREVGRPDEDGDEPILDHGQPQIRLWWD